MTHLGADMTIRDGNLVFEGVDVVALARQMETPFFLFSPQRIRWNVSSLVNAFTRRHLDTEIFFASKACSNLWFLDQVRGTGINIEVNAGGELWKAQRVGFNPRQIIFNGVAKTSSEIGTAIEAGIRAIIVDSTFELGRIADVAREHGRPARVDLRVDVDVATLTHPGLMTTHGGKAGIDLDDALDAFAFAHAHEYLDPRGLHLHIGSQITGVEPYVQALGMGLDLIDQVEANVGLRLDHLNAGGGFAIPYRDEPICEPVDYFCSPLTFDDYAEAICSTLERRRPDLKLMLEPGRSIAGNTAILVTSVENAKVKGVRDATGKRIGDERWLTVDAGFNTLLEHTNYRWYYRTIVASRADKPAEEQFRLAGPLCDGGDVFAGDDDTPYRRFPAATGPGDVVAFLDTGAYALEMMNPYNGRPPAAAYAVHRGEVGLIRTPESFDDLIASDVTPKIDTRPPHAARAGRGSRPASGKRAT
jgi:diaminopimelate decarboxylase